MLDIIIELVSAYGVSGLVVGAAIAGVWALYQTNKKVAEMDNQFDSYSKALEKIGDALSETTRTLDHVKSTLAYYEKTLERLEGQVGKLALGKDVDQLVHDITEIKIYLNLQKFKGG